MMWEWVMNGEELKAGGIVVAYFNVIQIYAGESKVKLRNVTTKQCRLDKFQFNLK
jgi:hypothetical protein